MVLIPLPDQITETGNNLAIGLGFRIILGNRCGFPELQAAKLLCNELVRRRVLTR